METTIGENKFDIDDLVLVKELGRVFLGKVTYIIFGEGSIFYYVGGMSVLSLKKI